MPVLDPRRTHPMRTPDGQEIRQVVHLNAVIDHPRMIIGDHSYLHRFDAVTDYAAALAPYLFAESPEQLVIGKFVQIAHGACVITQSANHDTRGFSTYPFQQMLGHADIADVADACRPGPVLDNTIGHDAWIGMDAMVMPGVTIGNGAIIAARSVVVRDVPPYTVVGGNPAKVVKQRFPDAVIARLQELAWWDWPVTTIADHAAAITGADLARLDAVAAALDGTAAGSAD